MCNILLWELLKFNKLSIDKIKHLRYHFIKITIDAILIISCSYYNIFKIYMYKGGMNYEHEWSKGCATRQRLLFYVRYDIKRLSENFFTLSRKDINGGGTVIYFSADYNNHNCHMPLFKKQIKKPMIRVVLPVFRVIIIDGILHSYVCYINKPMRTPIN